MVSNVCLVLNKEHRNNPIQWGLINAAERLKMPVYDLSELPKEDNVILYYNKPLKLKNKNVYWWMCDLREPKLLPRTGKYKHIFVCNTEYLDKYAKRWGTTTSYLPQCGDDRPIPETGRYVDADAVFIGGITHAEYHSDRAGVLNMLEGIGVRTALITGEGYSKDTKYIYNTAPFSLAISPNKKGYTSNRLYNILSSGGFCLTRYFEGIEDLFENHKHLCWFKTPEEAKEIVDYYYDNLDKYETIKKNGKDEYERKHTAKHRLETILSHIGEDLSQT